MKKLKKEIDLDLTYQVTLLLQITLAIYVLTFGFMSIYVNELFVICEALVAILMFVLAYNNQKVYKRKYMTYVYAIFGIIILASLLFV